MPVRTLGPPSFSDVDAVLPLRAASIRVAEAVAGDSKDGVSSARGAASKAHHDRLLLGVTVLAGPDAPGVEGARTKASRTVRPGPEACPRIGQAKRRGVLSAGVDATILCSRRSASVPLTGASVARCAHSSHASRGARGINRRNSHRRVEHSPCEQRSRGLRGLHPKSTSPARAIELAPSRRPHRPREQQLRSRRRSTRSVSDALAPAKPAAGSKRKSRLGSNRMSQLSNSGHTPVVGVAAAFAKRSSAQARAGRGRAPRPSPDPLFRRPSPQSSRPALACIIGARRAWIVPIISSTSIPCRYTLVVETYECWICG